MFVVNAGFNGQGKQSDSCYINNDGAFASYTLEMGPYERFGKGDGGLVADFNRDGLLDLFVLNGSGLLPANRGPYQLFLNRTENHNNWISFRLVGGGKGLTNRDAVGAKMRLELPETPGKSLWRFVLGGSGSDCQSTRLLHFGMATATTAIAHVYWPPSETYPKGHQQDFTFDVTRLNQRYLIDEIEGLISPQ